MLTPAFAEACLAREQGKPEPRIYIRHLGVTAAMARDLPEAVREYFANPPADWPLRRRNSQTGEIEGYKVELEAVPPDELDRLVRDALAMLRDDDAFGAALEREPHERVGFLTDLTEYLRARLPALPAPDEDDDESTEP